MHDRGIILLVAVALALAFHVFSGSSRRMVVLEVDDHRWSFFLAGVILSVVVLVWLYMQTGSGLA